MQKFLTLAAGRAGLWPGGGPPDHRLQGAPARRFLQGRRQADKVLSKLEAHLDGRDFLVGDAPTIADVAIYSYTAHAPEGDISLEPYPNVRRLLANIEALPGFVPMPVTKVGLAA